jgi:integrase/recombinase XerD
MYVIRTVSQNEPKMVRRKLPVVLDRDEASLLLKQPSKRYPTGTRNKAIMSLMLNCGLRLSEVTNLKPSAINLTKGLLRVVNGKGGKDRDLAVPEYAVALLDSWRSIKPKSNYFFSTLDGKKLSERYVQQMVKRYGEKAGISKNISPHTLRHSYATEFYRSTKDIETLRQILGHTDISTTTIYITLANIEVEKAMKSFNGFI